MDAAPHFIISFTQQGLYLAAQFNSCLDAARLHGHLAARHLRLFFIEASIFRLFIDAGCWATQEPIRRRVWHGQIRVLTPKFYENSLTEVQ
jgi:hypothetical protein